MTTSHYAAGLAKLREIHGPSEPVRVIAAVQNTFGELDAGAGKPQLALSGMGGCGFAGYQGAGDG